MRPPPLLSSVCCLTSSAVCLCASQENKKKMLLTARARAYLRPLSRSLSRALYPTDLIRGSYLIHLAFELLQKGRIHTRSSRWIRPLIRKLLFLPLTCSPPRRGSSRGYLNRTGCFTHALPKHPAQCICNRVMQQQPTLSHRK